MIQGTRVDGKGSWKRWLKPMLGFEPVSRAESYHNERMEIVSYAASVEISGHCFP